MAAIIHCKLFPILNRPWTGNPTASWALAFDSHRALRGALVLAAEEIRVFISTEY